MPKGSFTRFLFLNIPVILFWSSRFTTNNQFKISLFYYIYFENR